MNLIECLEQKERYTYNEGLIIDFILSHTERVLHMSIYELAEATNSSTSTIVRLCKKTETSGFKEFKIRLSRDLEIHYQAIRNVDANMPFLLIPYQAEQFYLAINATKNDVAILVSYSGNTAEIVNEARIFAEGGTPIIAITSDLNSQLAKYATVILPIPNVEHADFKVSTFSSQLAIEYILNVLYSCIFSRNFDKNYTSQKNTPTSILKF